MTTRLNFTPTRLEFLPTRLEFLSLSLILLGVVCSIASCVLALRYTIGWDAPYGNPTVIAWIAGVSFGLVGWIVAPICTTSIWVKVARRCALAGVFLGPYMWGVAALIELLAPTKEVFQVAMGIGLGLPFVLAAMVVGLWWTSRRSDRRSSKQPIASHAVEP